jgi:hypothetical protein
MQVIISSLLLIFALHLLLKGINYRKSINLTEKFESNVVPKNEYVDDKNDVNFQSNVLNTNRFYEKPKKKVKEDFQNQWKYNHELVMNGGELLNGITGYDTLNDNYHALEKSGMSDCEPSTRGAKTNDDLRMGLGCLNAERRSIT